MRFGETWREGRRRRVREEEEYEASWEEGDEEDEFGLTALYA